jgi:hypothetical protein
MEITMNNNGLYGRFVVLCMLAYGLASPANAQDFSGELALASSSAPQAYNAQEAIQSQLQANNDAAIASILPQFSTQLSGSGGIDFPISAQMNPVDPAYIASLIAAAPPYFVDDAINSWVGALSDSVESSSAENATFADAVFSDATAAINDASVSSVHSVGSLLISEDGGLDGLGLYQPDAVQGDFSFVSNALSVITEDPYGFFRS